MTQSKKELQNKFGPFSTSKEMKDAKRDVELEVWKDVERARVMEKYLEQEENKFILKVFHNPWTCEFSSNSGPLVSIQLSENRTPKVMLDKGVNDSVKGLVDSLAKSMLHEFTQGYLHVIKLGDFYTRKPDQHGSEEIISKQASK